jgi:hypothetical protein
MFAFLEPGFQSATVVYDGRVFASGEDPVPFTEMNLPLVGRLEPVFLEIVLIVKKKHFVTQYFIGSILIRIKTSVCIFFQVVGHFLANIILPPVVEVYEQHTGIEIRSSNLIEVMYEDIIASLVLHHATGIAVKRGVPEVGEVVPNDDVTIKVQHFVAIYQVGYHKAIIGGKCIALDERQVVI